MNREEFMIAPNKSVLVDMVYTRCHGRYNRDEKLDIEIVELPYNPDPVSIQFLTTSHLLHGQLFRIAEYFRTSRFWFDLQFLYSPTFLKF